MEPGSGGKYRGFAQEQSSPAMGLIAQSMLQIAALAVTMADRGRGGVVLDHST
jgi:hypothetical protein